MSHASRPDPERVLILAPTTADAALSRSILGEAGLSSQVCADLDELVRATEQDPGAILLTDEVITAAEMPRLIGVLGHQPSWSDVPVLLLSRSGADGSTAGHALESLGNVTVLERPVRRTHLISALQTAIRGRRRQYQLRDQIAALRLSEERFKLVAHAVHESIWDLDLSTGRFWSSEFTRPIFGYEPGHLEPNLEAWASRRHPDDKARVAASFRHALEGKESVWTDEYRFRRVDGSFVAILDRAQIIRDERGRATRVVGAMMDISDRKRAEEARALQAAIVSSSDDAIVSKTLDGIILSWNSGAERLFGYAASEAIGRPITMLIPPGKESEEVAILERLRRGQRIEHFETTRLAKGGREIDISVTISPLRDGNGRIIGASKVARDISVRRQAQETLRKQGERLRLLWEAASVLLTTDETRAMMRSLFSRIAPHLKLDAYFTYLLNDNGEGLRLESSAGISHEDMTRLAHLEFGDPICSRVIEKRHSIVATHIQDSNEPMVQMVKSMGLRAYACSPLIAEGRLLGTLSFASRQRDQFDAEELEFLRTICHYVTGAFERVRLIHQLRDTDRRKDEFLATLAHELRNPLAPIRNGLHIIRLAGDDPHALEQARSTMERQLEQMVRLIDDLLDVSRITRGRLELRKERVELASLVKSAVEGVRPLIESRGHRLTIRLGPEPIHLDADPVRLAQVLSNLLNNAAKYTDPGGSIWLTSTRRGDEVIVSVRDTGIGIAPDALPAIFDLFTQVDRSLEKSQGGLGIGLTLVKQLVEMHGGSVEARSDGVGRGAEFITRLPVAAHAPAPNADAVAPTPADGDSGPVPGRRILVADDNLDAAESMGIMLRLMGNDVHTVHDGEQAVDEAASFRPDVVLLDIGMPRLNGYDAARRIREQGWGKNMVLVALTGWGQQEDKQRASEAGFDQHFTKPLRPADLERLVAALHVP